jgi:hypothetical protein
MLGGLHHPKRVEWLFSPVIEAVRSVAPSGMTFARAVLFPVARV